MIPTIIMIVITIIMLAIVVINKKNIITRTAIVILLLVISQRPMIKDGGGIVYKLEMDVLFVIDNTMSMNAVDVNGNTRLNAIINDCKTIIDKMKGANFAIITYNNYSQVRVPFTNDSEIALDVLNNLQIVDPSYATGSTLNLPYDDMKMLLLSSKSKSRHYRVVFFISDGELTNPENLTQNIEQYKDLNDLIDNGAVLGYGSVDGAKIKVTDGVNLKGMVDNENYLLDKSKIPAEPAISKLDETTLKALANTISLDYIHMTTNNNINNKIISIKNNAIAVEEAKQYVDKDIYYFFTAALLILLLYELYYYRRSEQ